MRTPIAYRQSDPLWGKDLLGLSPASTVGGYGCLVASIASVSPLGLSPKTPGELNKIGRMYGGFVAGTGIGRLERLANLAGLVAPERLRIRDHDPADPIDHRVMLELIRRSLAGPEVADGFFVEPGALIVNVDHTGDARPDHFFALVAEGATTNGVRWFAGLDPAPGKGIGIPTSLRAFPVIWSPKKTKTYTVVGLAPIGRALR